MDAIVLDGEQRSALAVTRSLGKRGIKVAVGAEKRPSLSSCSRYCTESFIYPSPYEDPVGFIQSLKIFTNQFGNSVLFPMTDVTLTEILFNRKELHDGILMPFMDYDKYMQVTDKVNLFRLAKKLNVPVPTSFLSTDFPNQENLIETIREFGFPVVVKPCFSKIRTGSGWVNAKVHYAVEERKLREILSSDIFQRFSFLIQERIVGPGLGIFLLMKDGEVVAKFAHRRIREKPPSGGVSVLCESIEAPSEALCAAVNILEHLRWTGVAMVEFKIDREKNVAKLMEVNARFWGSLQLAISSGVDFPYMLFRLANGMNIEKPVGYTIGLKSRWELGDLDHLFIRFFKNTANLNLPSNHPKRMILIKDFLFDFFRPSVNNEILQSHDIKPFLHELKGYVNYFFH
jgi:predicted ATP-grasp superfamily ATP-dependent carboligase